MKTHQKKYINILNNNMLLSISKIYMKNILKLLIKTQHHYPSLYGTAIAMGASFAIPFWAVLSQYSRTCFHVVYSIWLIIWIGMVIDYYQMYYQTSYFGSSNGFPNIKPYIAFSIDLLFIILN
jgi:hypothetical protein